MMTNIFLLTIALYIIIFIFIIIIITIIRPPIITWERSRPNWRNYGVNCSWNNRVAEAEGLAKALMLLAMEMLVSP